MKLCFVLALTVLLTEYVFGTFEDETLNYGQANNEDVKLNMPQSDTGATNKEVKMPDESITQLSQINYDTNKDAMVDVSLNKESFDEDCYIRTPDGAYIEVNQLNLEGVKVQNKSNYVSCRITIGPMNEKLTGVWALCGKSVANEKTRCQPTKINLDSYYGRHVDTRERSTHPVHFGGSIHSEVFEHGGLFTLSSCHVITPAGEDLVFTKDVNYPHMEATLEGASCRILFKNINAEMLGNWAIYGIFQSLLEISEIRLPLTLVLYDENSRNVTTLADSENLVREGVKSFKIEVNHKTGDLDECIYITPSGVTFDEKTGYDSHSLEGVNFSIMADQAECAIDFLPVTKDAAGKWQIIGKFSKERQFDELRKTFKIILEDPSNPIKEPFDREIYTQQNQTIAAVMGTTHKIVIHKTDFVDNESCHLITPDGLQYAFIDGFQVPGVKIVHEHGVECGVLITLKDYNMNGMWTLLARATKFSARIEIRQPFNIHVEDTFVIQDDIIVEEGADVFLHFNHEINWPKTCKLYGPDGEEHTSKVEIDSMYLDNCGYIIQNVNYTHNGEWIIEYGYDDKIKGSVKVIVLASSDNLKWYVGEPLDITLGTNDTVYCKIVDNNGHTVYDNFGQCHIVIDRVAVSHRGTWKMYVGKPGIVQLQKHIFYVEVLQRDNKPVVSTSVAKNESSVLLTCSLPSQFEVNACKFRDPQNNILIVAYGVVPGRYAYNGSTVSYESSMGKNHCTLQLLNPTARDLGHWRCGMDTSSGTYYGFLTADVDMLDSDVATSVVTEPVLAAESKKIVYLEDEPVVMSCYIPAQVKYCYFRVKNGTVYNVFPGMPSSSHFEFVGSGFDAGECGIRFRTLSASESGIWSCHVGLDLTAAEQLATIGVYVRAQMEVRLFLHGTSAIVEATVNHPYTIDYCRFVRMDGHGFTMENVPNEYTIFSSTHTMCSLHISKPNSIDLNPWNVVVKLTGQDGEISRITQSVVEGSVEPYIFGDIVFWLLIVFISMVLLASCTIIPKRNLESMKGEATYTTNSFENSFYEKPVQVKEKY